MDIKQSGQAFREGWEARTGAKSPLSQSLTPEVRNAWRIVREMPEKAVVPMMNAIRAEAGKEAAVKVLPPKKFAYPSLLAALPPTICAMICSYFALAVLPTALVVLAVSVASVFLLQALERPAAVSRPSNVAGEARISVDESALNAALDDSQQVLQNLLDYLAEREKDAQLGYDVARDKRFGEWVQKMVNHANRHEENQALCALKGELISKLLTMGITVYDELETDAQGNALLPDSRYFEDARTGEQFTKVTRAIVYSRRMLLAKGEIA